MLCSSAAAQEFAGSGDAGGFGIFDEVRVGGSFSIQSSSPDGPLFGGQVLFGTFVPPFGNYFLDTLLRPRPHLGGTVATDDGTSQIYGGADLELSALQSGVSRGELRRHRA